MKPMGPIGQSFQAGTLPVWILLSNSRLDYVSLIYTTHRVQQIAVSISQEHAVHDDDTKFTSTARNLPNRPASRLPAV
jgi:hypothetical protein